MVLIVAQLIWLLINCISYGFTITNGRIVSDPVTSSSIALIQSFRKGRTVRSHGYRSTNECTGSLISSQAVITAGHCLNGWKGLSNVDMALLLLDRPIMVCNSNSSHPFEILKLPFKGLYDWSDQTIENSQCTIFGFGKNEKNRHLDYHLRSMPVRLKAESPSLSTALLTNQKICEVFSLLFLTP
uniref:Peptidase S1 domain-containing protein n=1 Tax=Syphacia muris TaxID=451379 RepID=A0A0N5ASM7_9BILA